MLARQHSNFERRLVQQQHEIQHIVENELLERKQAFQKDNYQSPKKRANSNQQEQLKIVDVNKTQEKLIENIRFIQEQRKGMEERNKTFIDFNKIKLMKTFNGQSISGMTQHQSSNLSANFLEHQSTLLMNKMPKNIVRQLQKVLVKDLPKYDQQFRAQARKEEEQKQRLYEKIQQMQLQKQAQSQMNQSELDSPLTLKQQQTLSINFSQQNFRMGSSHKKSLTMIPHLSNLKLAQRNTSSRQNLESQESMNNNTNSQKETLLKSQRLNLFQIQQIPVTIAELAQEEDQSVRNNNKDFEKHEFKNTPINLIQIREQPNSSINLRIPLKNVNQSKLMTLRSGRTQSDQGLSGTNKSYKVILKALQGDDKTTGRNQVFVPPQNFTSQVQFTQSLLNPSIINPQFNDQRKSSNYLHIEDNNQSMSNHLQSLTNLHKRQVSSPQQFSREINIMASSSEKKKRVSLQTSSAKMKTLFNRPHESVSTLHTHINLEPNTVPNNMNCDNENQISTNKKSIFTQVQRNTTKSVHGGIVYQTSIRKDSGIDPVQEQMKKINKKSLFNERKVLNRSKTRRQFLDMMKQNDRDHEDSAMKEESISDSLGVSQISQIALARNKSSHIETIKVQNLNQNDQLSHYNINLNKLFQKSQNKQLQEKIVSSISVLDSPKKVTIETLQKENSLKNHNDSELNNQEFEASINIFEDKYSRGSVVYSRFAKLNQNHRSIIRKIPSNFQNFMRNTEKVSSIMTKCQSAAQL
eukprot:403362078